MDRHNVGCSLDRLRLTRRCPGPCWGFSVLLKKMDGSAAPMLLPGILIQATAFTSPCDSSGLSSELSGVMNLCPADLDGRCYIFLSPGYKAYNECMLELAACLMQLDAFVYRGWIPCLAAHVILPQ